MERPSRGFLTGLKEGDGVLPDLVFNGVNSCQSQWLPCALASGTCSKNHQTFWTDVADWYLRFAPSVKVCWTQQVVLDFEDQKAVRDPVSL